MRRKVFWAAFWIMLTCALAGGAWWMASSGHYCHTSYESCPDWGQ